MTPRRRRALLVAILAVAACGRDELPPPPVISDSPSGAPVAPIAIDVVDGLSSPEAVVHDAVADVYLVSNLHGAPHALDDNGFITRLSPDGAILAERWIDGRQPGVTLHAPRGMAIHGDTLYVVDADAVRRFDRRSGEPRGSWPVPEPRFPNDVAVARDGTVYVTDTAIRLTPTGPVPDGTSTIWRFAADGSATAVARGPELAGPNGIVATEAGLVVAAFLGDELYRIEGDRRRVLAHLPGAQLDGVVALPDGSFLVTSWTARAIYRVLPDGTHQTALHAFTLVGPASIGFDETRHRLLVPLVQANRVLLEPFPVLTARAAR